MRNPGAMGVALAVLVVLAGAGPATATAPAGAAMGTETTGGTAGTVESTATATGVTVSLEPNRTSVDAGNATTFDVVVSGADRGVGAFDLTVRTGNATVATIDGATLNLGSRTQVNATRARLQNVRDDTAASTVTVATVTLRGETDGTAAVSVSVDTLADANDDPYATVGTDPATVEVTGTAVQLDLSANRTDVPAGGAVEFTVRRADAGDPVAATVTVAGRSHDTGADGRVAVTFPDEGTYAATASKAGDYLNDSLDVTVGSGQSTVTVSLAPSSGTLPAGDRTAFRVVVDGFSSGIGALDVVVNTTDASVAPVVSASARLDGTLTESRTFDGGAGMRVQVAGAESPETGPVTVARLRVEGDAVGVAGLEVGDVVVGDRDNQRYPIEERRNASVAVERRQVDLAVATNRSTVAPGETVAVTVTRTDTGEAVNATVGANGTARTTGADGRVTLGFGATGEYDVTASKAATDTAVYANATTTVAVERRQVDLAVATNRSTVAPGEAVAVTVTRADTGEAVNATVGANGTVRATGSNGTVVLRFGAADEYDVTASKADTATETYANATATVAVVAGPGRDLDGDGRYEDVDGDGDFDVVDVAVLLDGFEEEPYRLYPERFDFKPDGTLNVLDVAALLRET